MTAGAARVTLYSRPGCHLCDDARAVIGGCAPSWGRSTSRSRSTTTPRCERRFGEEIPVTFVDGRQHDFWRVDAGRLRRALARPR